MRIKLILCDFDGTITKEDVLDKICELANKKKQSEMINIKYMEGKISGANALQSRFELISGLKISDIENQVLSNIHFTDGAQALFAYATNNSLPSIVISGNADFVLQYFKDKLGFTDYVGSKIICQNGVILGWTAENRAVDKKRIAELYITKYGLTPDEIVSIGDSASDNPLYKLSKHRFIINQKNEIDYPAIAINSFTEIIKYIEKLQ